LSVSILIPAFRPTFLRQAIASALTQGPDDFDILISDDSGGDEVIRVVETFRDSRIRYVRTAGRIGAAENCLNLWRLCESDRMMFLFDDDVLLPYAMTELGAGLDAAPEASFAFGRRHVIDAQGRITREAPPNAPPAVVDGAKLATAVVGSVINHVGEFSNVMMNRACGLSPDDMLLYFGFDMHVVNDVGLYLNATRKGPAVGVGKPVAGFRLHGAQNSSASFNPKFPFGLVEWELFVRGELQDGRLAQPEAMQAINKLRGAYRDWAVAHPEVAIMAPGLDQLSRRVADGDKLLLDEPFRSDWNTFTAAVAARSPGQSPLPTT
jgi:glycosyltransferase involved in cell wall biosynthesis